MIAPFPLYIDEIDENRIKATVSSGSKVSYNLRMMSLDMPVPHRASLFNRANGIFIMPIGRFVCMLVRDNEKSDMVILDLTGKQALAEKMAEKLPYADLKEKFMDVYGEIAEHPENHGRFELVEGSPGEDVVLSFF